MGGQGTRVIIAFFCARAHEHWLSVCLLSLGLLLHVGARLRSVFPSRYPSLTSFETCPPPSADCGVHESRGDGRLQPGVHCAAAIRPREGRGTGQVPGVPEELRVGPGHQVTNNSPDTGQQLTNKFTKN